MRWNWLAWVVIAGGVLITWLAAQAAVDVRNPPRFYPWLVTMTTLGVVVVLTGMRCLFVRVPGERPLQWSLATLLVASVTCVLVLGIGRGILRDRVALLGIGARVTHERGQVVTVTLVGTNATDEDIQQMASLRDIRQLNLRGTDITDASLTVIAKLRELRLLNLRGTRVSDIGVMRLRELPKLQYLDLRDTSVSPDCIQQMEERGVTISH